MIATRAIEATSVSDVLGKVALYPQAPIPMFESQDVRSDRLDRTGEVATNGKKIGQGHGNQSAPNISADLIDGYGSGSDRQLRVIGHENQEFSVVRYLRVDRVQ